MTPWQKKADDKVWNTIEMLVRSPDFRALFAGIDYCYEWAYVALGKIEADFKADRYGYKAGSRK